MTGGGELADIKRRIEVMKESNVYYVINDRAESKNWVFDQEQEFRINGNGMSDGDENSFSFLSGNQTARWFHPCSKDGNNNDNWGVQATIISNKGTTPHNSLGHKHGNKAYEITAGQGSAHQVTKMVPSLSDRGEHGRFNIKFTAAAGDVNRFMAVIMPYKCNGSVPAIPIFHQSSDYISQLISLNGLSPAQNLHITKTDKTSHTNISNPFGLSGSSAVMDVKAEHAFMSYGLTHIFEMGSNCIAYTNFRKARVAGGSYLKYNDTVFISSNQEVEAHYELTGKFAYEGYCITGGSTSVVDFFLPDLEQGIKMVANGNISSYSYDTNTFIMTVVFPANTTTNFRFEMADPCKINCFYPDTNNHITNTFVQAGRDEYMPYKLKILQPNGQLIMADGAKMHICEFKWLNNRDSLIMVGKEGNYEGLPLTCQKNVIAERALNLDNGRTAIIVGNNASLVLDSGSYTRVGANSSIYVLPGGTLIVKPHAVLEIGSDDAEGYGEILADRGANVCVSPGAIIKFHRNDLDSTDKNRFYVYIKDFTQPTALNKTEPAISSAIEQMLYNDTLINAPGNNNCQPFCNYNTILPPHGIINRDWGYAPFVVPRATFKVAGDTLCPGDSVVINLRKVLNESGYRFSVCRVQDTLKTTPCLLGDTNAILKDYIQLSDGCSEKMLIPEELKFLLWDSGWYRIKVEVINECGINHDTTKYVYVPAPPDIVINMPDSICPGVGTLIADGSQTQSYRTRAIYKWTALLVVPDSIRMQEKGIDYGGDWGEFDSTAVTNSFNFPDFRFYGGFKYAIGLSVKGWCGWVTKWDTVNVPLAAYIKSRLATNYQNPIGPSAFELKGYVTGATSYAWSPTTYLDEPDSLTTIARPDQPITYILSATDGGVCYDYDTMHVAHNEVAYAGENALLCFNEK
ncbi:MAG: hypothetical protein LW692_02725 [Sphingobacteriales bacterium]|nr:hypothetical protein [Sphingobacteriales bacterium]